MMNKICVKANVEREDEKEKIWDEKKKKEKYKTGEKK